MQSKIAEIASFKKGQEAQIIEKLLKRNDLKAPSENDSKSAVNAKIDEKVLLEDVKFYHTERLKAIYAERAHFNFTSIQSIADEINSLKLLNPTKANNLLNKYESLLTKGKYETTSIFSKSVSTITNAKGELFLNNKNIAKDNLLKENATNEDARMISGGYLATGYNSFIVVTYAADIDYSSAQVITGYTNVINIDGTVTYNVPVYNTILTQQSSTTLTCFVYSSVGYVLYPCYFYTKPTSYATFNIDCGTQTLNFGVGVGSSTKISGPVKTDEITSCPETASGYVSGNYAIPSGSTFLWVSGTKNF